MSTELRPTEREFKALYQTQGARILDQPHTMDEIRDILLSAIDTISAGPEAAGPDSSILEHSSIRFIMNDSLVDEDFIENDLDAAVYQHLRYLPVFWHKHNFFEIACVLSGSCTNYIVNQEIPLQEGDICIIAPEAKHAIRAFSDQAVIFNILLRTQAFENNFFSLMPPEDILTAFFAHTLHHSEEMPYLLFHTAGDTELRNYIGFFNDEYHRNRRYKNNMLNSILSAFFITLMRNHEKDVIIPTISKSVMNENLIFILRYMQDNYNNITLQHLADFFNYSPRHIERIIKTATGNSFKDNILRLRMQHAKQLLQDSSLTVTEIAEDLGYYDDNTFRRYFREYCHTSPSEFRKSLNK